MAKTTIKYNQQNSNFVSQWHRLTLLLTVFMIILPIYLGPKNYLRQNLQSPLRNWMLLPLRRGNKQFTSYNLMESTVTLIKILLEKQRNNGKQ